MKILILSRNYYPELTGIGPYTAELCEYLAQNGADVTVITSFPYYPYWSIPKEYRGKWILREKCNSVHILRTYMPVTKGLLKQFYHEFSFSFTSLLGFFRIDRSYDIILCISPPLTLGLTAYFLSRIVKIPFIFHIQDLLPDTAINLGMLKDGKAAQMFRNLETFIYERASAIGVISSGFAENLRLKDVSQSKINYLPNWVDLDFIKPLKRENIFREENKIPIEKFTVMYSGNIGNKQGLEIVLDAAFILKEYENIIFFIVGEGSCKAALMEKAEKTGISNMRFLTLQPKEILPYMLAAADVLTVTQQASVVDIVLPSKLLTYMASATPVVASVNSNSEAARVIDQAKSGLIVEPENAEALTQAILDLRDSNELREELGANGRSYVSEHFEKSVILRKFQDLIYSLAG